MDTFTSTPQPASRGRALLRFLAALPTWLLAAVPVVFGVLVSRQDHFFRDELYFMVASRHPDLGYVEFPMMTAVMAAMSDGIFGDSLLGLRLFPALAASATLVLTVLLVRELGGGRLAQFLAALGVLVAPVFLVSTALFGPDAFDRPLWAGGVFVLARMLRGDAPRLWLVLGGIMAVGLMTKMTMLDFALAIVVGLLLSSQRGLLRNRYALYAGLFSLVGLIPYLFWELKQGFPTLTLWATARGEMAHLPWSEFLLQQIRGLNPATLPLAAAGLCFLFLSRDGKPFRPLGLAFLVTLAVCVIARARPSFIAPAYAIVLAAGAVILAESPALVRRVAMVPYAALLLVTGGLVAIVAAPMLPPDSTARVLTRIHADRLPQAQNAVGDLRPYLAGRYGWQEMVATVASVYHSLTPEEQDEACILVDNYGRAAAIDFYGYRYGLPQAMSGHNNYFLWGTHACSGRVIITTGGTDRALRASFDRIDQVATVTCARCMPSENNLPVWVARDPLQPVAKFWPSLRHLD